MLHYMPLYATRNMAALLESTEDTGLPLLTSQLQRGHGKRRAEKGFGDSLSGVSNGPVEWAIPPGSRESCNLEHIGGRERQALMENKLCVLGARDRLKGTVASSAYYKCCFQSKGPGCKVAMQMVLCAEPNSSSLKRRWVQSTQNHQALLLSLLPVFLPSQKFTQLC